LASFEREIYLSFKYTMPQAYFRRIYDRHYTGLKPFDFELFYQGFFFALEAKHQKGRLSLRRIHPHQKESLEKIMKNGGLSYFLIRIEDPKKFQNKFRAFVLYYPTFVVMIEELSKRSCNAQDLENYAEYEAKRIRIKEKYYGWSFPEFFEKVVRKGENVRFERRDENTKL